MLMITVYRSGVTWIEPFETPQDARTYWDAAKDLGPNVLYRLLLDGKAVVAEYRSEALQGA